MELTVIGPAPEQEEPTFEFLCDLLRGLAVLHERGDADDPLLLALAISVWMRRHDCSAEQTVSAALDLRRAVVRATPLDDRTEPVPLRVGDPRVAALSLGAYLADLVSRAARAAGASPSATAERALDLLAA